MAKADAKKKEEPKKKSRLRKQPTTVRELAQKKHDSITKAPRKRRVSGASKKSFALISKTLKKEYHPVKLPNNKVGKALTKRRSLFPKYFIDSWRELRLVTWPDRKSTARLTISVFVFAIVFATIIKLLDMGLEKIFKQLLLG